MADKFAKKFGTEAHPLKIGKSFDKKNDTAYHSIRYDFKPGSIDEERKGSLEVEENNSVSVRLPHTDGQGATNYKGSAKPANTKDCVLIIDWETGELRLERVSNQILLKKTRAERTPSVYSDFMNNDVNLKDCVVPPPSSEYSKKELENHEVKKEHDNHPKIKEHQMKKEPDKHQNNVQQQMSKSDVLKKVLSPPAVKQETETIPVPLNDSLGLGLGLSDSSDDSDSDSDSSSGSQSDSSAPSSTFSRKGQLPTARPQKLHKSHMKKKSVELKVKASPQGGTSMPSLGDVSSMPSLGDVSSMPSLGDVSSMPSIGDVSSMPSIGDVSSMPSLEDVSSKPSLGNVSSMPSLGDVASMPSLGFGESSSSEQKTRKPPLPPVTSSSSVASKAAASADSSMPSIANRSADLGDDLELSDSDSE